MPHIDRFGAQDTGPQEREAYYAALRRLAPERRLQMVIDHMTLARKLNAAGKEFRQAQANARA